MACDGKGGAAERRRLGQGVHSLAAAGILPGDRDYLLLGVAQDASKLSRQPIERVPLLIDEPVAQVHGRDRRSGGRLMGRFFCQFNVSVEGYLRSVDPLKQAQAVHKFLSRNQTLAGRSASRRMYQGNQSAP